MFGIYLGEVINENLIFKTLRLDLENLNFESNFT